MHVLHAGPARRALVRRARGVAGGRGCAVREVRRVAWASRWRSSRRCGPTCRSCTPSATVPTWRERAGIGVIADVGNCWMERDPEDAVRRAGARLAVVQFSDAVFGTFERPSPGGRVVPGDGDLALDGFVRGCTRRRVRGSVRARGRGARDRGRGSRRGAATRRRPHQRAPVRGAPVSRAIVFHGDETWDERDLPVPEPQPGGAVLRVEATGLCHSDFDHFQGRVHTPYGGEYPSIAGHEIVGRIETITPEAAEEWGVGRGRPGRGAQPRRHRGGLPDLRPRLLGRRRIGSLRRVRRASRAAPRLGGVPSPRRSLRRGADRLRAAELRGDLGAPGPGGGRRGDRRARSHGHGHHRGGARRRRADGDRDRDRAGPVPSRRRACASGPIT